MASGVSRKGFVQHLYDIELFLRTFRFSLKFQPTCYSRLDSFPVEHVRISHKSTHNRLHVQFRRLHTLVSADALHRVKSNQYIPATQTATSIPITLHPASE